MNIRILIADDHQLFIDGLKSILRQEIGIQVIGEAGNGLELLKLLDRMEPDVILTDIRMPVMDGITACKEIKNKFPHLPILALSMYDQPSDIVEML
ncbi:MAG: response regulator transcription factor, partial [Saprospiraceae bacterium]|nr:response regulator transcription factor [Saprospiraceae bacterium]